jgi:hypothetical protein
LHFGPVAALQICDGFVQARIKALPNTADALDATALQDFLDATTGESHATCPRIVGERRGEVLERTIKIIEGWQKLVQDVDTHLLAVRRPLVLGSSLVIEEVRSLAAKQLQQASGGERGVARAAG